MNIGLVGTHLGKCEIQAEIGRGGMGAVYRGYDGQLDRHVAVKVLAPYLVWEEEFVERFFREARAAARLKHPGIVTIHDVGKAGGWYYLVMECLEGQTLTRVVRQRAPLPSDKAIRILRPLAEALD
jgi:serine/threonine-protein kinase